MDLRIGVIQTAKELSVELPGDADREAIKARIASVLSGAEKVLWVTDRLGRDVGVAAERIAYVELGGADGERRVGFGI